MNVNFINTLDLKTLILEPSMNCRLIQNHYELFNILVIKTLIFQLSMKYLPI